MHPAHYHRIFANEAVHHYVTAGPEFPLGILHGFPQAWLQLHPVIERVRPRFRMIAPDLPGIGGNPGPGGGYDEHSLASDVTAILPAEEIDEPVVLCGHNMGRTLPMPTG
jgi:pimeloyl-ACP methyl ester carboxylesterase